jgi:diacylglycerol kinase (ATP)
MTTNPHPREPRLPAETSQLVGREPPTDRAAVPFAEERVARDAAEHVDGDAREPVPMHVGHDDGAGGEPPPVAEQGRGLGETEVVEQHRGHHDVEALLGERQPCGVRADDADLRPRPAGGRGVSGDDGVLIDGGDPQADGAAAGPAGEGAGDVGGAAADVEQPQRPRRSAAQQSADRTEDAAGTAEVPIGDLQAAQGSNGLVVRAAEGVRSLGRVEPGHPRSWSHAPSSAPRLRCVQIIVNPRSGNGRGARFGRRLASRLRTDRYDVRVLSAEDLPQARERLVRTGRDLECLIGIGGDATLSATAAVALELQVPLLPVPAGFGNIFAQNFGYRATLHSVLELLEGGTVARIDVGRVGHSVFLSNRAFGFTEDVKTAVETAALPRQRLRRYVRYYRAAASSIARAPLPTLGVEADGERLVDGAVMVVAANVPTYRGFLSLTPAASPFDGLLDVFAVPRMPKTRLVALLLAFLVHAPGRWREVRSGRAARVRVTAPGQEPCDLRVLPSAVPVLLHPPPGSGRSRLRLAS